MTATFEIQKSGVEAGIHKGFSVGEGGRGDQTLEGSMLSTSIKKPVKLCILTSNHCKHSGVFL